MTLLPGRPDRTIDRLFAVIVTDPDTGLEGIAGMGAGISQMQAVTSRRDTIEKALEIIRAQPWATAFKFEIVEFVRKEPR